MTILSCKQWPNPLRSLMKKFEKDIIKHIINRLEQFGVVDRSIEYLEMVNCLTNLIWEYENKKFTGSDFSREWRLGSLTVVIKHNKGE